MTDLRRSAPAALRNRDPILAVLREVLPKRGLVLEIASGTGEHVVHFARDLPGLTFQPSDPDADALQSIAAWTAESGTDNVRPPVRLDAAAEVWPVVTADAIVCINMIHISPWDACAALFAGAARTLSEAGVVYLYGPYKIGGAHTAESNRRFDSDLRARNPAWGIRDLDEVTAEAASRGFDRTEIVAMPANNHSVVFTRRN
jgi:cyclopropane fatty-acyl-phospholipid synthase-like methyltransferase